MRTIASLLSIAAICILIAALIQDGTKMELRLRQIGWLTVMSSFGVYLLSLHLFKSGER